MIFYPALVTLLQFDNVHAGIFLGGTIHDVAQVVGAGYMISPEAGDISTYIKLLRVALLLPVVFIIAFVVARASHREAGASSVPFPLFLLGFAVLVGINSTGVLPEAVVETLSTASRWCLVTAIAALGMKTSFRDLFVVGWRPIGLMVAETAFLAVFVLSALLFIL